MAFTSNPLFESSQGAGVTNIIPEEDSDLIPKPEIDISETGWFVNLKETNYNLERKLPVQGKMSIGELTLKTVESIGRDTIKPISWLKVHENHVLIDSSVGSFHILSGASFAHQPGFKT